MFIRLSYLIFALISYAIYLFSIIVFVFRLLDTTQFLKPISFEFQFGVIGSICINIALVLFFGVPHSVMARAGFKNFCRKIIPLPIERSFYVLITSITLIVLSCLWQPIDIEIWNIQNNFGIYLIHVIFSIGLFLAVLSSFLIDHFELFGLKQAWSFLKKSESHSTEFSTPSLYKLVRHPMMFGILLALWSTTFMKADHLILSIGMTLYIIIGTFYEERDLIKMFGEKYLNYKRAVPMLLPFFALNKGSEQIRSKDKI
ncbi:isoprenylcysteine carboxylmethyltransferase family protein [Leptospira sarikeiensis]|uniref:Isoprenylcysteine carboxylmethyltransferase family protein n=2 Tax=Leptospira sarikeiensis TaxID=2484943 RepID=A0A4R9KAN1_9LEPT|nr:methyltransferase [Leptospira sarikeiensis]TGL63754.1 isoprenylcysteine carboxylmethyltransferase family protein [Leptospira sarikeiensis]